METLKIWLSAFVSFIVLDSIWFLAVAGKFIKEKLSPIARLKADGSINFSYTTAIITYILMATAFVLFVWPKIKTGSNVMAFVYSAILGLVIYGVYDFTNLSFIKNWPVPFATLDILWGTLAFGITALILKALFGN